MNGLMGPTSSAGTTYKTPGMGVATAVGEGYGVRVGIIAVVGSCVAPEPQPVTKSMHIIEIGRMHFIQASRQVMIRRHLILPSVSK
jgi:hypothetical protein